MFGMKPGLMAAVFPLLKQVVKISKKGLTPMLLIPISITCCTVSVLEIQASLRGLLPCMATSACFLIIPPIWLTCCIVLKVPLPNWMLRPSVLIIMTIAFGLPVCSALANSLILLLMCLILSLFLP